MFLYCLIFYQITSSEIQNCFVLQTSFFPLKFAVTVYVSSSIISSQVIAESSIKLTKYFPFLQLHVAGFQMQFFYTYDVYNTPIDICCYSTIDLNYMLFQQSYIYSLLMLSIHLFLQSCWTRLDLNLAVIFGRHTY